MDWLIEALKVLREVRDWARDRAVDDEPRRHNTHAAVAAATERVELVVAEADGELVPPMGPASQPKVARRPRRGDAGRTPAQRRHEIPIDQIDPHAISAVRRLRKFGYKAYLVGGCVRDLMLGLTPKDFDVSTDARPEEVKSVFRNSRIIGRRFRLVHLYFKGGKIIEVATFRANVTSDEDDEDEASPDLMIRRDNVFGTEEEDARRRDFTINGLFYDVHEGRIIDHVGGVDDVRERYLRMIGDPDIRLREDPVRILRALRFTAKADLRIDPDLATAIREHVCDISKCAPARVLEETLKLLRTGHAEETVRLMDEYGVLQVLLPEIKAFLDGASLPEDAPDDAIEARAEATYRHLAALDAMVLQGAVSDVVVLGALLYAPLETFLELMTNGDRNRHMAAFLAQVGGRIALTRKLSEHLRQVFMAQRQLEPASANGRRRRRTKPESLMARGFFPDALNLYEIHARAAEEPLDGVDEWYERVEKTVGRDVARPIGADVLRSRDDDESSRGGRGGRRRGGRRRRRR